ncbi:hypothetical protein L6452_12895 [Arctium lappa]|uniref:Uncharacterized protein n=1 Tax=Arctium lappa TaxID=4217 RepID=A0ACB9CH33_ARCLA|nr:hypothetical protein L6452_12895 [Arctium lappa]
MERLTSYSQIDEHQSPTDMANQERNRTNVVQKRIDIKSRTSRRTLCQQSHFSYNLSIHEIFKIKAVKPTLISSKYLWVSSQKQFSDLVLLI